MENRNDVSVPEDETVLAWNTFCLDRVRQLLFRIDEEHHRLRQVFVEYREVNSDDPRSFTHLMRWLVAYEEAIEYFFYFIPQLELLVNENEGFVVTNNPCVLPQEVLEALKYVSIYIPGIEDCIGQNVRGCELLKTVILRYIEGQASLVRHAQQELRELRYGWVGDLQRHVDNTRYSLNV